MQTTLHCASLTICGENSSDLVDGVDECARLRRIHRLLPVRRLHLRGKQGVKLRMRESAREMREPAR